MIKKYKDIFSFSWGPKFLAAPLPTQFLFRAPKTLEPALLQSHCSRLFFMQEKIKESLEELCKRLPGPGASKICKDQIDKNLPMAIAFLTSTVVCIISLFIFCGNNY